VILNIDYYRNFNAKDSKEIFDIFQNNYDIPYWCGFNHPKTLEEC
jgi:hypothetical protein